MDGAHAIGTIPHLNVPALGADYYTSNLHKWMCSAKGCALLWVAPAKQASVKPLVVSHGYGLGFRAEFLWQGTMDLTAWLTASASVAMMRALHHDDVLHYNHTLVRDAADVLLNRWHTQGCFGLSDDGSNAGMVAIELPSPLQVLADSRLDSASASGTSSSRTGLWTLSSSLSSSFGSRAKSTQPVTAGEAGASSSSNSMGLIPEDSSNLQHRSDNPSNSAAAVSSNTASSSGSCSIPVSPAGAAALNQLLRQRYSIEVPVACMAGCLWVRISAEIYNEMRDYQRLADVIQMMHKAAIVVNLKSGDCDSSTH